MDNMGSTGGGGGEFSSDHSVVIERRKRSKRQRLSSPLFAAAFRVAAITSSYSSGGGGGGDGGSGSNSFSNDQLSPSISTDWTAEVEEEVVDCLMLLAKGSCPMDELRKAGQRSTEKFCSRRTVEMATGSNVAAAGKDGYVVYECKTCYRTFPSFQALGGHSASHKRPKVAPAENTERSLVLLPPLTNADEEEEEARIDTKFILSPLPLQMIPGKGKAKVHGCSICGTEFMSGQALGGHMRRHRTTMITPAVALNPSSSPPPSNQLNTNFISTEDVAVENRNNMLMFDLNLPAPEDDHRSSNSEFASASRGIDFLPIFE